MRWTVLSVTSILLVAALLASGVTAHDGDRLSNASGGIIWPGNPCQNQGAQGLAGGVAVDEANGRLYYSLADDHRIFQTSTTPGFTCQSVLTAPTAPAVGFTRLAFDPFHGASGILWAAPADQSGTVLGLNPTTMAVVQTLSHAAGAGSDIVGLAVEEQPPYRIHVAWEGSTSIERFSAAGAAAGSITLNGLLGDLVSLSGWGDDLLAGDSSQWIRHHELNGQSAGRAYRPHNDYIDEFFQPRFYNDWGHQDTALDQLSYAGQSKAALFTSNQVSYNVCVENCPVTQCVQYGPEGCIQWQTTCPSGDCTNPTYQLRQFPQIRAYEVCIGTEPSDDCVPTDPCDPEPLWIDPVLPQSHVYIRGTDTGTVTGLPLAIQSDLPLRLEDPSGYVDKQWQITGPVPGLPLTINAAPVDIQLDTSGMAAGQYTVTARLTHTSSPCTPDDVIDIPFLVGDPYLASAAQNVRIEGNIPIDLVAGTIRQEPFDHLIGREQLNVATGHVNLLLPPTQAKALDALAHHEPRPGAEWIAQAHADTDAVALENVDLRGLCLAVVPLATCNQLPGPTDYGLLHTEADAAVNLLTGSVAFASSKVKLVASPVNTADECDDLSVAFNVALQPPLPPIAVYQNCPSVIPVAPGFTIYLNEDWTNVGQDYAEAYANIARIEIDIHPYRGHIILGESWAGASLAGPDVFIGVPPGIDVQDDFDTGSDAPSSFGPVLGQGVYSGHFLGQDRNDAFQVNAAPGDRLRVALDPSHRVQRELATLPTPPASQTTPRLIQMELLDASGVVRDSTRMGFPALADARPDEVVLNVDGPGPWRIELTRLDNGVERAPYTITVDIEQVVLLPGDGVPPAGDAANTCPGGAPALPATTGSLGAADPGDLFTVSTAGGTIAATLQLLDDPEGADFDLHLLDASCNLIASSTNGKTAPGPKGMADAINQPVGAGTYHIWVERANGIGNYALGVQLLDP